jgi:hypothetical protein
MEELFEILFVWAFDFWSDSDPEEDFDPDMGRVSGEQGPLHMLA